MSKLDALDSECSTFTRLLTGRNPNAYVLAKYRSAHAMTDVGTAHDLFDTWSVSSARRSVAMARLADGYCRLRRPDGTLRRKLVLMLAILETAPPYFAALDRQPPRSGLRAIWQLIVQGFTGVACVAAGLVAFAPVHWYARWREAHR